jgi:hypothetical protein
MVLRDTGVVLRIVHTVYKIFGMPATVAGPLIVVLIASVVSQCNICFPWNAETELPIQYANQLQARQSGWALHTRIVAG